MNLGGNRRWVPLRKFGTNHLIPEIGISQTFATGVRGGGVKGATPNPSAWFDKKKTSGTQGSWWPFPLHCLNFNKFCNTAPLNSVINLDNFT